MKKVLIIGIITLLIIPPAFAAMQSIIPDMSFESNSKAELHHYMIHKISGDPDTEITAEPWFGDSYSGKKSVHLQAQGLDVAEVGTFISRKIELDDITEVGFYYKLMPESFPLSPYIEMSFYHLDEGWPSYFLTVYQWRGGHISTNWKYHNVDRWYYVYATGTGFEYGGLPDGIPLSEIQGLFDGYLGEVDINVGNSEEPEMNIDVLVDHLIIKIR